MQRRCPDLHICRKCRQKTAECWYDEYSDDWIAHGDVKFICPCGFSWWEEGSDS